MCQKDEEHVLFIFWAQSVTNTNYIDNSPKGAISRDYKLNTRLGYGLSNKRFYTLNIHPQMQDVCNSVAFEVRKSRCKPATLESRR